MSLSDSLLGTLELVLGVGLALYLFFILMLLPILPIEDNNFVKYTPPDVILLASGIFGLLFVGSLVIFTLVVLFKRRVV